MEETIIPQPTDNIIICIITNGISNKAGLITILVPPLIIKNNHITINITNCIPKDIKLDKDDPQHFYLQTYVYVSDQFFGWLWGFGRKAVLIEPQELVDKYIEKIQLQQLDIYKTQTVFLNELKNGIIGKITFELCH